MPSLSKELRRLLEKTIAGENGARQIAEDGAEQSLRRLAVDRLQPHSSLTPEEKILRSKLWAHGRQLGDRQDSQTGTRSISRLTQAVAYEHWHRLLFARFLAENDLLLHPEHHVALSLDEVKELALGQSRDWIELAAEYAQRMLLREVFRSDDIALRTPLSREKRGDLEAKLNMLPREIFLADDSLGWVYQFWQRDAKEKVEEELQSGEKADASRIPAKTQLFTEDYMVLFLLENTLGAWWTARQHSSDLPGYSWTYLRLGEDRIPDGGTFDGWPKSARELKLLDPCMGSGHFLTFALPILASMRETEEGLSRVEAIAAVLRENLFGLELDPRCSQIAAFNLALTAWKLAGGHFELPSLNLACSGLGINAKEEDWIKLAGDDVPAAEGMRRLYSLFKDAPTLGSLIDPLRLKANVYAAGAERVLHLLEEALKNEGTNDDTRELVIAAQGVLAAFRMLSSSFNLVITNVPYLGRGKQDGILLDFCDLYHADARADLATCFVDRAIHLCAPGGTVALVSPENWIYQVTYSDFVSRLKNQDEWNFLARLGPKAFQTPMWDFNVVLLAISRCLPPLDHSMMRWDASKLKTMEKAQGLIDCPGKRIQQCEVLTENPTPTLGTIARCYQGISTGDNPQWLLEFWEVEDQSEWRAFQTPSSRTIPFEGRSTLVRSRLLSSNHNGAAIRGAAAWGKRGVAVARVGKLYASLYSGELFANVLPVIIPNDESYLPAIWTFAESEHFDEIVREVNQGLNVDNGYFEKVPFDYEYWAEMAKDKYPDGLPKPHSDDPTQWLFSGQVRGAHEPLQVAVARLVGYEWPRQAGLSYPDCVTLEADGLERYSAADGIACLSAVAGEESAGTRLRTLLQAALGDEYSLAQLLSGKKSGTLEGWLRDEFFAEHCEIFHNGKESRPFLWHIWDGLKDGFHAIVNYHKLDRRNLEKLIYSYLGDWLTRRRQDVDSGAEGAETRLAAAEHLQGELKKILEGQSSKDDREPSFDIFVRWKPLSKQAMGWEPDLNDGVRANIRPWITAGKVYKATKPGLLRVSPNIKYAKDRGKETDRDSQEFPWFANSADRINDYHLSLDEKRHARGLS
jgi:hypothetical protein